MHIRSFIPSHGLYMTQCERWCSPQAVSIIHSVSVPEDYFDQCKTQIELCVTDVTGSKTQNMEEKYKMEAIPLPRWLHKQ